MWLCNTGMHDQMIITYLVICHNATNYQKSMCTILYMSNMSGELVKWYI